MGGYTQRRRLEQLRARLVAVTRERDALREAGKLALLPIGALLLCDAREPGWHSPEVSEALRVAHDALMAVLAKGAK